VYGFLEAMDRAYNAADLIICRAGALTVSEVMFFRIPAVLIPYPYAQQHQMANAEVLNQAGAAVIVDDAELKAGVLEVSLFELLAAPDRLKDMKEAYNNLLTQDAGSLLAEEVLAVASYGRE
jgi:UDP-N-acetylglucosamine--N-acetylmuramyl-(pentapeptide) pyrophosphoryl-undecaprenol N-acetylglucosamine transferase